MKHIKEIAGIFLCVMAFALFVAVAFYAVVWVHYATVTYLPWPPNPYYPV